MVNPEMLAGRRVDAQLSPAGVICKTEHYLTRERVSRGPRETPWRTSLEPASPKNGNSMETSKRASLPFQHTRPGSIWPIINPPGSQLLSHKWRIMASGEDQQQDAKPSEDQENHVFMQKSSAVINERRQAGAEG